MIKYSNLFLMLAFLVSVTSCVDTDFDEPDVSFMVPDDKIVSIADVLAELPGAGAVQLTDEVLGSDELYVSGVVSADDESGNLFKVVYFQDETGALVIEPDQNELNAAYPEGSIVYIRLNNLYLVKDSGVPKLAYAVDGTRSVRTPDALVKTIIFAGGPAVAAVVPEPVTLGDLQNNAAQYFNQLVQIQDVELTSEFLGATYAIAEGIDGPETLNAMLQDCNGREIILRNSGFSNFAGQVMPLGNGAVNCIVNRFGSDLQLFIRDTDDMMLDSTRCDGSVVSGEFPENELSLATIKGEYLNLGVDKIPDGYIEGVVISDGGQQNITNRNLVLQTDDSGIVLRFSSTHNYDLGQVLQVNVSGRSFSTFSGLTQIDGMSALAIREEGTAELPEPQVVTVAEMNSNIYNYESVRVKIEGATISGPAYSFNLDVTDGTGTITTFIQSFATFNGQATPTGSVDIVGYGGLFNDPQILINGPSDVTGGGGTFPTNEISLSDVKSQFLDFGVDALPAGYVEGVVISDMAQGNITNRNLVLQSGTTGVVLRFGDAHSYGLGELIRVDVTGKSFSEFRGLTQIDGLSASNIMQQGSEALPTPVVVTASEMSSNIYNYESVRVLIEDATISGPAYSFNLDVTDATGTIVTFIQSFATFNGQPTPTGSVDIVGYGGLFDDPQILINGPSDVTGGGGGGGGNPGTSEVNQDFDGETDFELVDFEGWLNVSVKGDEPWYFRSFDDNGFAECEAFQAMSAETESWLITPTIDTDMESILEFETAQAFWQHQGLSVWVSPDFTDVSNANWTELTTARIANEGDGQYDFIPSGEVNLKDFSSGKVRVGWRYVGTSASNTTKMRIDNVSVK